MFEPEAVERELAQYPMAVASEYRRALPAVQGKLALEDFAYWGEQGLALARYSFRSWEAAVEYFRATAGVMAHGGPALRSWTEWGKKLCQDSPLLAAAYFRATPQSLPYLVAHGLEDWAQMGGSLYKGTWRSGALACAFFEGSPCLLRLLIVEETGLLARFLGVLAEHSYDLASECLNLAEEVFTSLEKQDRAPALNLCLSIVRDHGRDARACFEASPKVLARLSKEHRSRFLALTTRTARLGDCLGFFLDGSRALGEAGFAIQGRLLQLFEALLPLSPQAAQEFLKSLPGVLERIQPTHLDLWFQEGARLLAEGPEAGIAYFRLESVRSHQMLEQLSSGVDLTQVGDILRRYSQALCGRNVHILPTQELVAKGIGWSAPQKPSTEGNGIYLPGLVNRHLTKEQNFTWYKVATTHQVGHLEFGSFDFQFQRPAVLFPTMRPETPSKSLTDMERFFDLFGDRRLAQDVFTIAEDTRIDGRLKGEYRGIRSALVQAQQEALTQRPALTALRLREAFLEAMVRLSLAEGVLHFPRKAQPQLRQAARILATLQKPETIVEDAAEATIRLYSLVVQLPDELTPEDEWEPTGFDEDDTSSAQEATGEGESGVGAVLPNLSQGETSGKVQPVDFRGDFKPELVQLLKNMRLSGVEEDGEPMTATPQELQEFWEKNAEIVMASVTPGEVASSGQFVSNLLKEASRPRPSPTPAMSAAGPGNSLTREDELSFLYDEWDFRAGDYRPRWCRVRQRFLEEGTTDFFEKTLQSYFGLSAQIKKQFELIAPELFRKIKRLPDGEEFDLDSVIEAFVEKRAGQSPTEKVYWRRNKVERDVAVAFLLDMSASTAEAIEEPKKEDWDVYDDPSRYMARFRLYQGMGWSRPQYKRIIDVEKEGLVLLVRALETIGDTYGIYGFSGYGRENVEFFIVKDMDEPFSDKIKRRIDKIAPLHATRMGPAIRHATYRLESRQAKTKILFLLSDGRPQDHGYSRDGVEKEYAIHDTKAALVEARRKNITPFCLTVDRAGHDYLKVMCQDMGYEVLSDIQSLPSRLPALYRKLTI